MAVAKEDLEQINTVNWFRHNYKELLIFHIPNGEKRDVRTAMKLKKLGVVAGVPDLFIPSHQLWVEMKKVKGGVVSQAQKEMIAYLESVGYTVLICKGFEEAKEKISEFLNERI